MFGWGFYGLILGSVTLILGSPTLILGSLTLILGTSLVGSIVYVVSVLTSFNGPNGP